MQLIFVFRCLHKLYKFLCHHIQNKYNLKIYQKTSCHNYSHLKDNYNHP